MVGGPLSGPTLQSKKGYGVYHILAKIREKGTHTIGPERRVYTIVASDPEQKKNG